MSDRFGVWVSPSGASRWSKCKASPGLVFRLQKEDRLPDTRRSWSDEGTRAHELASTALLVGYDVRDFKSQEMAECVRAYVEHCEALRQPGDVVCVERRMPLWYAPEIPGTVDFAAYNRRSLRVRDLKYGEGVTVEAEDNAQIAIYARAIVEEVERDGRFRFDTDAEIGLGIFQPRARDGLTFKHWTLTIDELFAFTDPLAQTARDILRDPDNQPYHVEDNVCQFCPAKALCETRQATLLEIQSDVTDTGISVRKALGLPDAGVMTLTQLAKVVELAPRIRDWLKSAEDLALGILTDGGKLKGCKLVESKPHRKWSDDVEAAATLRRFFKESEVFKPAELITPAAAQTLLKERKDIPTVTVEKIFGLMTRPEGQPKLAFDSDPREPVEAMDCRDQFSKLSRKN